MNTLLALALLALPAPVEDAPVEVRRGLLGEGTAWETGTVVVTSPEPGPTVLVFGGVHGDEPAGAMAAEAVAGWRITRGKLVVVPSANVRALAAGKRRTPGDPQEVSDLNRCFPMDDAPRTDLARALWGVVERHEPDVLLDLHEGFDFHRTNPKSVGSSVIASRDADARRLAARMIEVIDATISDEGKRFDLLGPPIQGSLARAASERLGVTSMIVETTKKGQAATFRARQHRVLVHTLLTELEMAAHGPHVLVGTAGDDGDLAVAMYVSGGVSGSGPDRLEALLDEASGFDLRRVSATDVRGGVLDAFDVAIFPGGSGSGQARELGESGRARVVEFVRGGGGYVGVCAGAYLAASNYDWSLGILDANVIDRSHWARGRGSVDLDFTEAGRAILAPGKAPDQVRYANGPLYARAGNDSVPDFEVWATYESEINTNGAPEGIMLGTPALVIGTFGEGHVVASSPHPEQTKGMEELTRRMVRQAAASDSPAPSDPKR